MKDLRVALVYDRVNKWGGAEQIVLALHKIFPQAPLFTSVYNKKSASWASDFSVKASFLQKFPKGPSSHELYALLMPIAFESFNFDEFDVVISVSSEAGKGIITKPHTFHLEICLTPTRYLWSGYDFYFSNKLFRFIAKPAVWYLRAWDKVASVRADAIIAISEEVQGRISKYYESESEVIYPPVNETSNIKYQISNKKEKGSYFLVVSRLVSHKRIDIVIEAVNKLKVPLKIIGTGVDEVRLKRIAGDTVEFLGFLSNEEVRGYCFGCKALIFPGIEDFGLSMVEAQAAGTPVIAYRDGGALEIVKEGVTGEFFDEQNTDSLSIALKSFDLSRYNRQKCIENSERFSLKRFEKEFLRYFEEKVKEYFGE